MAEMQEVKNKLSNGQGVETMGKKEGGDEVQTEKNTLGLTKEHDVI